MKKLHALVAALLIAAPAAYADIGVTALGGFNFHKPDIGPDTKTSGKFTYGALVNFGTPYGFSLETGLMDINKKFAVEVGGVRGPYLEYDAWEIPLLARFNIGGAFSAGLGGYYQIVGDLDSDSAGDTDSNDYGLKASLRAGVPIAEKIDFVVEGQVAWGLKDLAAGAGDYKNRELRTLAGIQFGF